MDDAGMTYKELAAELARVQSVADYAKQRIDNALMLIDAAAGSGPAFLTPDEVREVRAALEVPRG